jgi:hypothetical protein
MATSAQAPPQVPILPYASQPQLDPFSFVPPNLITNGQPLLQFPPHYNGYDADQLKRVIENHIHLLLGGQGDDTTDSLAELAQASHDAEPTTPEPAKGNDEDEGESDTELLTDTETNETDQSENESEDGTTLQTLERITLGDQKETASTKAFPQNRGNGQNVPSQRQPSVHRFGTKEHSFNHNIRIQRLANRSRVSPRGTRVRKVDQGTRQWVAKQTISQQQNSLKAETVKPAKEIPLPDEPLSEEKLARITAAMEATFRALAPPNSDYERKLKLVERLQNIVAPLWPGKKLFPFTTYILLPNILFSPFVNRLWSETTSIWFLSEQSLLEKW